MEEVPDGDNSTISSGAGVQATSSAENDEDELKLIRRFHVLLDEAQSRSES